MLFVKFLRRTMGRCHINRLGHHGPFDIVLVMQGADHVVIRPD